MSKKENSIKTEKHKLSKVVSDNLKDIDSEIKSLNNDLSKAKNEGNRQIKTIASLLGIEGDLSNVRITPDYQFLVVNKSEDEEE